MRYRIGFHNNYLRQSIVEIHISEPLEDLVFHVDDHYNTRIIQQCIGAVDIRECVWNFDYHKVMYCLCTLDNYKVLRDIYDNQIHVREYFNECYLTPSAELEVQDNSKFDEFYYNEINRRTIFRFKEE